MMRICQCVVLLTILFIVPLCVGTVNAAGPISGFNNLINQLENNSKINTEYVILPAQVGRFDHGPPHAQYDNVCWVFALQTGLEYLGFAKHFTNSHYLFGANTLNDGNVYNYDAGYYASPEHLMLGEIHGIHYDSSLWLPASYYAAAGTPVLCSNMGSTAPDYGECAAGTTYFGGHDHLGDPDSPSGNGYIQDYLTVYGGYPLVGCNDYKNLHYESWRIDDLRRIMKAFIDNNTPITLHVRGGHNHTLIGYTDIDSNGLPITAIGVDAHMDANNVPRYYLYENLDSASSWEQATNDSIWNVRAINQHLEGACEPLGWASQLDAQLSDPALQVCDKPAAELECADYGWDRYYGFNLECYQGFESLNYHATPEAPFISLPQNVACDDVVAYYADGRTDRHVTSSRVDRFGFNPNTNAWVLLTSYNGTNMEYTLPGRTGHQNMMEFYNWPDNYRMVGQNISGTYTKRRTTVTFQFNTGQTKTFEIAPPGTYGVIAVGYDNGQQNWVGGIEADQNKSMFQNTAGNTQERQFIVESTNKACDGVDLWLALGELKQAVSATVARYGYHTGNHRWQKLNTLAPWPQNQLIEHTEFNHTGTVYQFVWRRAWPDNNRLVAEGLSGTYSDITTIFKVQFNDGSTRQIEIVPR